MKGDMFIMKKKNLRQSKIISNTEKQLFLMSDSMPSWPSSCLFIIAFMFYKIIPLKIIRVVVNIFVGDKQFILWFALIKLMFAVVVKSKIQIMF
jgi:hypothetical protein